MPLAPEYEAMFAQLAEQPPGPALWEMSPAEGREFYRAMRPVNPELAVNDTRDTTVPGTLGEIPVRIYTPQADGPHGVLVYFHGGGWVIGDVDTCDSVCQEICTLANLIVVSVDYRMAPEDVYPAAVTDSYDVVAWVASSTAELASNGKIGVAGESAGGNLSAVVAQKARDENGPTIDFQCLLYPVTDIDMTRQSYADNGSGYILETEAMNWFWDTYCPDKGRRTEAYATPLNAASLAGLPPALVITAEFDPLRDEGKAYADALTAAGNTAEYLCCDGMVHDFFAMAALFPSARTGFLHAVEALKTHLN